MTGGAVSRPWQQRRELEREALALLRGDRRNRPRVPRVLRLEDLRLHPLAKRAAGQ
jgi:hypothetical protein